MSMRQIVVVFVVFGLVATTVGLFVAKGKSAPMVVPTVKPKRADIVKEVVAAGVIQPRKEIEIKPRVAGILKSVFVEAGQRVRRGQLIAEVEIIPDFGSLNEAELRLQAAQLKLEQAERERRRLDSLARSGAVAVGELDTLRTNEQIADKELSAAKARLLLAQKGSLSRAKGASTRVESTVDGIVLEVAVREGASVINANSFNPGTTVAVVADMSSLVFRGAVDEIDVGQLEAGMHAWIELGALRGSRFTGKLERVAPRSVTKDGINEFEIEVAFHAKDAARLRAGYSANAHLATDRRDRVLAVDEAAVRMKGTEQLVEVQVAPGRFEERPVRLGLSDGLFVEVISGVKEGDILRKIH